ncbi:hypothetical protein D3C78_1870370 [compost metagenome]
MPIFGKMFDEAKISNAGGASAFEALKEGSAALDQVLVAATTSIFQTATLLPCMLVVFFALAWLYDRKRKKTLVSNGGLLSPQA